VRHVAARTAVVAAALLCSIGACSSTVSGQPSGTAAIPASTPAPASSPATTSATKPLPGGSEPQVTDETLVLGTNQLGTHQFNVDGAYDPALVAQGVVFVLTRTAPSGFELSDVSGAQCPAAQTVTAGTSFTCTVNVSEQPKKVTVDIISNQGWYIVGEPK